MPRRIRLYLALASLTIVLDQLTKWWARNGLPTDAHGNGLPVSVIDGYWDWILAYNTGSAFSMFAGTAGSRVLLSLVALVAVGGISWMAWKARDDQRVMVVCLSLMAGGAIGNLIDRVLDGKVTDFVLWRYHDLKWPVFNVADVALSVAVGVMVVMSFRRERAPEPRGETLARP